MCFDIMQHREDTIAYFETDEYLNRDMHVGEASRFFFKKKIALVSPAIAKYLEDRLFSVFFFQGQNIYFQIVPTPPPPPPPYFQIVPIPSSESYDRPLNFKLIFNI